MNSYPRSPLIYNDTNMNTNNDINNKNSIKNGRQFGKKKWIDWDNMWICEGFIQINILIKIRDQIHIITLSNYIPSVDMMTRWIVHIDVTLSSKDSKIIGLFSQKEWKQRVDFGTTLVIQLL